ncbi:MAG: tetratricopeptide repeat protein [bacterium]|nr:tetratricopeptide repeat protein [bacterium]
MTAALLLGVLGAPAADPAAAGGAADLAEAAALIEDSRPEEALDLLNRWLKKKPKDPQGLLLRSTAHFMIGDLEKGKRDLDRSLELDPRSRQAWLNRAALELADEDYAGALEAFGQAETLDDSAADNSLNIGTVLLLLDRFDEAAKRFKDYLTRNPGDPQARYLVASNYAMRGFAQPAIANLRRAVALDERMRRRARTDPNFAPLNESPDYQELLNTDGFRHARGAPIARQSYDRPYLAGQSQVLDAVISSLQLAGQAFDPQVEVTPRWALVWSDLRIKVSDDGAGGTQLELSAPPGRFSPGQWQALTEQLLRGVTVQLHTHYRRDTD